MPVIAACIYYPQQKCPVPSKQHINCFGCSLKAVLNSIKENKQKEIGYANDRMGRE